MEEIKKEEVLLASDCDQVLMEKAAIQVFGEDYVDFTKEKVLIHFPEFDIINDEGAEHTILNLYIQLNYNFSVVGKLESFGRELRGFRTTLTYEEAYSGYLHSHLYPLPQILTDDDGDIEPISLNSGNFCLGGSSDINTILSTLNMEFSLDQYMILLLSLDDFVRWESLNGGPYILMQDIQKFGNSYTEISDPNQTSGTVNANILKEFYKVVNTEEFKHLIVYPDSVQTILSTKEEFRALTEQAISIIDVPDYPLAVKYKGSYYLKTTGIDDMVDEVDAREISVNYPLFKGESLGLEIIQVEKEEILFEKIREEGITIPHPIVLNTLLLQVEEDLHKHLNNQDKWKLIK